MSHAPPGRRAVRVAILEDHEPLRAVLRELLTEAGMVVVAEAGSGSAALRLASAAVPDVILMDLRMPGLNGIEATNRLRTAGIPARVVILTGFADGEIEAAARRAGAVGVLLKGCDPGEIVAAVRRAWALLPARA